MAYNTFDVEDFISWANRNREDYYELYDEYIHDVLRERRSEFKEWAAMDADEFLATCIEDVETAQDVFEEVVIVVIEELEDDDYFGTEGFDKRFE